MTEASATVPNLRRRYLFYRHGLLTRLTHWANALILLVLLMSGLQIFNAHPALYFGKSSDFDHPALSLTAAQTSDGAIKGETQIGRWRFSTTGWLGASAQAGQIVQRGFPAWATLPAESPNLALGRLWHFAFAWLFVTNGVLFAVYAFGSGHFWRDLLPRVRDIQHQPREIIDHARLKFPKGEAAKHYNALQK